MFLNKHRQRLAAFLLISAALLVYMSIPAGRLYWPYMLSAYWMGIFVYMRELKELPAGKNLSLPRYLFPREIWLHPSSVNDCVLVLVNFVLFYVLLDHFYTGFGPDMFQTWTKSALGHWHTGATHPASGPGVAVIAVYALAAMLLSELFFYISHRLQHTIPVLWEFHKVHHSAKVMTPLTVTRVHPAVFLLDVVARNTGIGVPSGIFLFLYPDAKSVSIAAATVAGFSALNVVGGNLHHSHIWLRFHPMIERFVTSPALHQIHHSDNREHHGKNYGTILTFWDWVFGSLYLPKGRENITFGLGNSRQTDVYQSLRGLYVHPVRQAAKRIFQTKQAAHGVVAPVPDA